MLMDQNTKVNFKMVKLMEKGLIGVKMVINMKDIGIITSIMVLVFPF